MRRPTRRELLRAGAVVPAGAFAGCLGRRFGTEPTSSPDETPVNESALTGWERVTDCGHEHDGMYDSVIKVEAVMTELSGYSPIPFATLSPGEKRILRTVTTEGGYGMCGVSGAFRRFVDRVNDHTSRQSDGRRAYLVRDGTYYRLYVEVQDQVYAY